MQGKEIKLDKDNYEQLKIDNNLIEELNKKIYDFIENQNLEEDIKSVLNKVRNILSDVSYYNNISKFLLENQATFISWLDDKKYEYASKIEKVFKNFCEIKEQEANNFCFISRDIDLKLTDYFKKMSDSKLNFGERENLNKNYIDDVSKYLFQEIEKVTNKKLKNSDKENLKSNIIKITDAFFISFGTYIIQIQNNFEEKNEVLHKLAYTIAKNQLENEEKANFIIESNEKVEDSIKELLNFHNELNIIIDNIRSKLKDNNNENILETELSNIINRFKNIFGIFDKKFEGEFKKEKQKQVITKNLYESVSKKNKELEEKNKNLQAENTQLKNESTIKKAMGEFLIEEASNKIDSADLTLLKRELKEAEEEITKLNNEKQLLEKQLKDLMSESQTMSRISKQEVIDQNEVLKEKIKVLELKISMLNDQLQVDSSKDFKHQIMLLEDRISNQRNQINDLTIQKESGETSELKNQLEELKANLENVLQEKDQVSLNLDNQIREIEDLKKINEVLIQQIEVYKNKDGNSILQNGTDNKPRVTNLPLQISKLQDELKKTNSEKEKLVNQNELLKVKLSKLTDKKKSDKKIKVELPEEKDPLKLKIQNQSNEITVLKNKLTLLNQTIATLKDQLIKAKEKDNQTSGIKDLTKIDSNSKEHSMPTKSEFEKLTEENNNLKVDLEKSRKLASLYQSELDKLKIRKESNDEIKELEKEIEAQKSEIKQKSDIIDQLRTSNNELREQIKNSEATKRLREQNIKLGDVNTNLREEKKNLEKQNNYLNYDIDNLNKLFRLSEDEVKKLCEDNKDLNSKNMAISRQLEKAEGQLNEKQNDQTINKLQEEINSLKNTVEKLSTEKKDLNGKNMALSIKLEEASKNKSNKNQDEEVLKLQKMTKYLQQKLDNVSGKIIYEADTSNVEGQKFQNISQVHSKVWNKTPEEEKIEILESEGLALKKKNEDLTTQISQLNEKHVKITNERDKALEELENHLKWKNELEEYKTSTGIIVEKLNKQIQQLNKDKDEFTLSKNVEADQFKKLEEEKLKLEQGAKSLNNELAKIAELEKENKKLSSELYVLQTKHNATVDHKVENVLENERLQIKLKKDRIINYNLTKELLAKTQEVLDLKQVISDFEGGKLKPREIDDRTITMEEHDMVLDINIANMLIYIKEWEKYAKELERINIDLTNQINELSQYKESANTTIANQYYEILDYRKKEAATNAINNALNSNHNTNSVRAIILSEQGQAGQGSDLPN